MKMSQRTGNLAERLMNIEPASRGSLVRTMAAQPCRVQPCKIGLLRSRVRVSLREPSRADAIGALGALRVRKSPCRYWP